MEKDFHEETLKDKLINGGLILAMILSFLVALNSYLAIPKNSEVYVAGSVFNISDEIEGIGDVSLNSVSVRRFIAESRLDFIKDMWKHKTFHRNYAYRSYENMDKLDEANMDMIIDALQSSVDKVQSILDYTNSHFEEEERETFLTGYVDDPSKIGDSNGLAILLTLIGKKEEKDWLYSEEKIAVTGAIDEDGNVKPVGNVPLKYLAAKKDKATIFIVPEEQLAEAYQLHKKTSQVKIVGVSTATEAIAWLDENVEGKR